MLVDQLPATEFKAARRFLEYLRDGGENLVSQEPEARTCR